VLRWQDGLLRLDHHLFQAEVDPARRRASLFRRERATYPLDVVLRTSLLSRLPLDGGLPLHAAGVVTERGAIAFFGPSGAGKATLAATSRDPSFLTSSWPSWPAEVPWRARVSRSR
jgi:hypothetical protein